mmetsp:Transcript_3192/g.7489  ORF Transcript_3192/g.7489 Transcript_3192/m.7489 type:complete len:295 (-) Transcript_3192:42-926(-)
MDNWQLTVPEAGGGVDPPSRSASATATARPAWPQQAWSPSRQTSRGCILRFARRLCPQHPGARRGRAHLPQSPRVPGPSSAPTEPLAASRRGRRAGEQEPLHCCALVHLGSPAASPVGAVAQGAAPSGVRAAEAEAAPSAWSLERAHPSSCQSVPAAAADPGEPAARMPRPEARDLSWCPRIERELLASSGIGPYAASVAGSRPQFHALCNPKQRSLRRNHGKNAPLDLEPGPILVPPRAPHEQLTPLPAPRRRGASQRVWALRHLLSGRPEIAKLLWMPRMSSLCLRIRPKQR